MATLAIFAAYTYGYWKSQRTGERLEIKGGYLPTLLINKGELGAIGVPKGAIPSDEPSVWLHLKTPMTLTYYLSGTGGEWFQQDAYFESPPKLTRLDEIEAAKIARHDFEIVARKPIGTSRYIRATDGAGRFLHYLANGSSGTLSSLEIFCRCESIDEKKAEEVLRSSAMRLERFHRDRTIYPAPLERSL